MQHVAQVGFFVDPQQRAPRALLDAWPSLVDVAEAAALSIARVSVIQAAVRDERHAAGGVEYRFVPVAIGDTPAEIGARVAEAIRLLKPDVVHVHGLGFPEQVAELAHRCPGVPILLQDHADRVPRWWRRSAARRGFGAAAGVAFCAREQATAFVEAGVLPATLPVFEVPESSCRFAPGDRAAARAATGLFGAPCVLWVGRLDRNKDPVAVLDAFHSARAALPGMQLWCCFQSTEQLAEVHARLGADPELRRHVHLLGHVPHSRIETLMRAADVYVSASHRESTGYGLIEALACGLTPVVTDIPSFRALTGRGTAGHLWPVGDARALARALVAAAGEADDAARVRMRAHFDDALSFAALGARLARAYQSLRAAER